MESLVARLQFKTAQHHRSTVISATWRGCSIGATRSRVDTTKLLSDNDFLQKSVDPKHEAAVPVGQDLEET